MANSLKFVLAGVLAVMMAAAAYYLGLEHGATRDAQVATDSAAQADAIAPTAPAATTSVPAPASGAEADQPRFRFSHFRVGNRNVKSLLPDGDLVWVGTSGGVVRYDTGTDDYTVLDTRSGLLANGIFHLSKLGERLAVGTYGGGLAVRGDGEKDWAIYNIPEGLADAFVYDVLVARNGDIWIATWSGANRVRGGALDDVSKWETYTVANTAGGLPNDWVYALDESSDGTIWMATEGGLARFKDEKWTNWQHEDGLGAPYEKVRDEIQFRHDPAEYSDHHARQKQEMGLQKVDVAYNPNYIVALHVDADGIVWCGTWGGGLARFDGQSWSHFTTRDGLPGNHVFSLHRDPAGRLWVGTSNGLARRAADGSYANFTTADGLFSNIVFSIATGADGSLWVGSYGGVARFKGL